MKRYDHCLSDYSSEAATMALGRVMDPEGEHGIQAKGGHIFLYRDGQITFTAPVGTWIVRRGNDLCWQVEEPK